MSKPQYKQCSSCRQFRLRTKFAKHGTTCNTCRAEQNRIRLERARNRAISKAIAFPRVVA